MNKTDHIITKDSGFECLKCGEKYNLKYPILISSYLKKAKAFIELHRDCK